jgi:hypothetical protein
MVVKRRIRDKRKIINALKRMRGLLDIGNTGPRKWRLKKEETLSKTELELF